MRAAKTWRPTSSSTPASGVSPISRPSTLTTAHGVGSLCAFPVSSPRDSVPRLGTGLEGLDGLGSRFSKLPERASTPVHGEKQHPYGRRSGVVASLTRRPAGASPRTQEDLVSGTGRESFGASIPSPAR